MDDDPRGARDEEAPSRPDEGSRSAPDVLAPEADGQAPASAGGEPSPAGVIASLPWDDDLPLALGEETEVVEPEAGDDAADASVGEAPGEQAGDGLGRDVYDYDYDDLPRHLGGRPSAPVSRRESWRTRSATGAIATALAMGLQQVFEPEKRRPAAVAEAPSDPYSDDDPITVDYLPDDAGGTRVHVKPWLLQKEDPA